MADTVGSRRTPANRRTIARLAAVLDIDVSLSANLTGAIACPPCNLLNRLGELVAVILCWVNRIAQDANRLEEVLCGGPGGGVCAADRHTLRRLVILERC